MRPHPILTELLNILKQSSVFFLLPRSPGFVCVSYSGSGVLDQYNHVLNRYGQFLVLVMQTPVRSMLSIAQVRIQTFTRLCLLFRGTTATCLPSPDPGSLNPVNKIVCFKD